MKFGEVVSVVDEGGSSEEGEFSDHQKGGEVSSEARPVFEEARGDNASSDGRTLGKRVNQGHNLQNSVQKEWGRISEVIKIHRAGQPKGSVGCYRKVSLLPQSWGKALGPLFSVETVCHP